MLATSSGILPTNKGTATTLIPHELRNEIVEELLPNLVGENRAELDAPLPRDGRKRGMKGEKSR